MSRSGNQAQGRDHIRVIYAGVTINTNTLAGLREEFKNIDQLPLSHLVEFLKDQSFLHLPDIILIEADSAGEGLSTVHDIKKNPLLNNIIIILLSAEATEEQRKKAFELKIHDYYVYPFPMDHLLERLSFLVKFRQMKPILQDLQKVDLIYKTPSLKRLFDIVVSITGLILLSPFLLLIALIIKLDSRGPIMYKSKRVGTGYKVFDFYKFRSMRIDADRQLSELAQLNQYSTSGKKSDDEAVFIKIKDDPRITRIGKFLRNTSIDELPQLINVIKGEMSLVGNRPLPLYEAEQLTSNEWSMRFLGPAGVTGLWQISRRGKNTVSATERKKLDNFYAMKYSFRMDLMILLKTLPALFQKENV